MTDPLLPAMAEAQQRFMDLVAEVRPELHRYCARMTGSVFDGEDVVQDTLAKAYFALGQMEEAPPLRPWLFRIAHNTAMDFLRRYEHKNVDVVAEVPDATDTDERGPDPALVEAALILFASLPPLQRSALALKDVLGHSLEEVATTMDTTVAAVKAALVRARATVAAARPPAQSEPLEHGAEQELGAGVVRVQLRGLLERLDGIAQLIAFEEGVAQRQERGDRVGTQLDRLAELCDGGPVLAPLEQRVSTR